MANLTKIVGKIMTFIPKTEGAAGRIRLTGKQLELLAENAKPQDKKLLQELLHGTKNPTLDIAYKAKSNYSIAGVRLQDGDKRIAQGAVSVVNPGRSDAVVKTKISVGENGKVMSANGFIDGGKPADATDMAAGFTRRGGNVTADVSSGRAFSAHVALDEKEAVGFAGRVGAAELLKKYTYGKNKIQCELDKLMVDVRKMFRGEATGITPSPVQPVGVDRFTESGKVVEKVLHEKALNLVEISKGTKRVIPGVLLPKPAVIYSDTFEQIFGITEKDMAKKLSDLAKTNRPEFEKMRIEMGKNGWQPYFDRHTGKLKFMKANDMDEVTKKLKTMLPSPQSYTEQGRMRYSAERAYNRVKDAEYTPDKMHAYKQKELETAFANFEDKVPLNKREWSEILHQNVDDIIESRFI